MAIYNNTCICTYDVRSLPLACHIYSKLYVRDDMKKGSLRGCEGNLSLKEALLFYRQDTAGYW